MGFVTIIFLWDIANKYYEFVINFFVLRHIADLGNYGRFSEISELASKLPTWDILHSVTYFFLSVMALHSEARFFFILP